MTKNIFIGFLLYVLGHFLAWYQINSQFAFAWAKQNMILPVLFLAVPMGLCFLYGTKLIVGDTQALWVSRFVGFGASYFVFPVLTWHHMNESMFTVKTMSCILLSCVILWIQIFWE
jgi:hypothetical protein